MDGVEEDDDDEVQSMSAVVTPPSQFEREETDARGVGYAETGKLTEVGVGEPNTRGEP